MQQLHNVLNALQNEPLNAGQQLLLGELRRQIEALTKRSTNALNPTNQIVKVPPTPPQLAGVGLSPSS